MSIHVVPPQLPSIAQRIDGDPDARTCTIWYVRRELGRIDYGDKRICSYLQKLVDQHGFPAPFPCERKGRRELETRVVPESRWIRAAVDAWLEDRTPPDLGAALDRKARDAAAAEMDAAAGNLSLVGRAQVAAGGSAQGDR